MKKIIVITAIILTSVFVKAQDVHFSQFNYAPMALNPALTGAFNANHRIITNYRNQWRSVTKPYTTYGISYDMGILKDKLNGGVLGIGIQLYNDQAGDNKMGLTQANVSVAYHLPVNENNYLTAGIQGGFSQRRVDKTTMQWDNQYDPTSPEYFNSTISSGETSTFNSLNYGDFSAGILYTYTSQATNMSSNDAKRVNVGLALYHINRPKQIFMDLISNKLFMKFAFHVNSFIGFKNTNFSMLPSGVWYNQGPSNEIILGSLFRYRLNEASKHTSFVSETALAIGGFYRVGDAVIVSGQFEWKNFMLAVSYDVNVSKLSTVSKSAGGLELSLRFVTPLFDSKKNSKNVRLDIGN
jgi:type IX secretion system PorP/SprF family membrane protein